MSWSSDLWPLLSSRSRLPLGFRDGYSIRFVSSVQNDPGVSFQIFRASIWGQAFPESFLPGGLSSSENMTTRSAPVEKWCSEVWSHRGSSCPEDLAMGASPSSAGVCTDLHGPDWASGQGSNPTYRAVTWIQKACMALFKTFIHTVELLPESGLWC